MKNLKLRIWSFEFKSSLADINEIVEDVSAFANSKGWKIIIGISNSGKVLGIEIGRRRILYPDLEFSDI